MDQKNKPVKNKRTSTYRGLYTPKNPKKYIGNSKNIIYRSLWERKFMIYCDTSEQIIEWSSEELAIPYLSPLDKRVHRYFPDFIITIKESDNTLKKYVIEIKPKKQTTAPPTPKRKTQSYLYEMMEYSKNEAKWEAARKFCKDKKLEFKIITEDELGIKR